MSQQQPPTPPEPRVPGPGPGAPPSGWAPAPLSGGGRPSVQRGPAPRPEPGTPLGGSSLAPVSIGEFAPPRSRLPLVVTLVAALVAGLIWIGTSMRPPQAPPAPSPSASPSSSTSAPGLPFVTPDQRYAGRWEILSHQWTATGLEVEVRIAVDRGPVSYSFLAFGNNDVQATEAEPGSQQPQFSWSPIPSGGEETGWLLFRLERGATTIILAEAGGSQIAALPVTG